MEYSKGKKITAFVGCFLMAMVVQVSTQALNNISYPLLDSMGRADLFVLTATLSGLGMAVMCPIGGKLGDLFGRPKVAAIGGIACFVLHIMLAFITSPVLWVIVRSMIPFAIGLFLSIPFSLPAELFPESYPQKIGLISGALAAGIVVGSYGGGLLYQAGFAKAAVIVPGLFAIAGALMIITSVHNRSSKNVKIDVMGFIWLFVMLTALCLVLSFASTWGYLSVPSIIGYVVTIGSAIILFKTEQKVADPCMPFKLFKNKVFLCVALFAFFSSMYQYVIQVYTPLYGQNVLGLSTGVTGSFQLPRTIVCIIAPILCAAVLKKSPRAFRSYLAISAAITIISFILLVIPGSGDNITMIYVALALTGIGEGFKNISSNPLAITTLEPQNIGIGIALMSSMGSIGAQVSAAIIGLVFNASLTKGMATACFSTYYTIIVFTVLALVFILSVKLPKPDKQAQA
jgi:MFS family permease